MHPTEPSRPAPTRAPLPEDPWSLPAPGASWDAALDAGVAALGLTLTPGVRRALDAHSRLLMAWTEAINLTAVRAPDGVARLHLVDSLSAVPLLARLAPPEASILDLGSGGGMPGLPLAVALRAGRLLLVDSIAKKVRFLDVAARAAGAALEEAGEPVPLLEAVAARAEDLARQPVHRGAWDVVTARAVGTLAELVELAMPLLVPGGLLVCWKRDDGSGTLVEEVAAAGPIARAVGAGAARVDATPEAAVPGHRLVVLRKERPTPDRFPRTPAERKRAPNG
ncbi:MAG: 16S rRNA (guanine(527)-N(7))-methyltransferase RsmG [Chloroflexota bacterium]